MHIRSALGVDRVMAFMMNFRHVFNTLSFPLHLSMAVAPAVLATQSTKQYRPSEQDLYKKSQMNTVLPGWQGCRAGASLGFPDGRRTGRLITASATLRILRRQDPDEHAG